MGGDELRWVEFGEMSRDGMRLGRSRGHDCGNRGGGPESEILSERPLSSWLKQTMAVSFWSSKNMGFHVKQEAQMRTRIREQERESPQT